jgi:hypothetical protein
MTAMLRLTGQFVVIVALFAAVSSLAAWPVYRQTPQGSAVVVLAFVHSAARKVECRRLTPQEIAKLPPNMRRVSDCPRERLPVYLEFDVGGRTVYRASLPPTGIAGDGPSRVYQRFVVPAGEHSVAVRMRDTARTAGFDHERVHVVSLVPDQMFVVDFRSASGEFVFR